MTSDLRSTRRRFLAQSSLAAGASLLPMPLRAFGAAPSDATGPFQPTWESIRAGYQYPEWFRDASRKGDTLYAILMAWPGEKATIASLAAGPEIGGKIAKVELLGHRGAPLKFTRTRRDSTSRCLRSNPARMHLCSESAA